MVEKIETTLMLVHEYEATMKQQVSSAEHKDWRQAETASKIFLPAALKIIWYIVSCVFNLC